MRRVFAAFVLLTFAATGFTTAFAADVPPSAIKITPPAPRFSDTDRQAELARRRSAVAAKMVDKSMLILFSTEPKLYTNDVDYVYRQENNLYYLTALRQNNATFVMTKDGNVVKSFLFMPKPNPQNET